MASGGYSTVGGGWINTASGHWSTIGGGRSNNASGSQATVGGGEDNNASGDWATVGGGNGNTASALSSTVGGGGTNMASGIQSTVGGGFENTASSFRSTVGGGFNNTASAFRSTIGGGSNNTAGGSNSTVPGGTGNAATGNYSFAAGRNAKANNDGMFVWADSDEGAGPPSADDFPAATESNFTPAADQFLVRAHGGVVFVSATDADGNSTAGVELAAGGGSWSSLSSRDAKANVDKVDGREVLERLRHLPIATWNYKPQDESIRHIGPMAQDFSAAFGVGEKETMITTIDADGVALAAIQGLYEMVQEKDAEIAALRAEMDDRIAALATKLAELTAKEDK